MTKISKCKISTLIFIVISLHSFQASAARPSINDMQTCQGLIDFVSLKLENLPKTYNKADVEVVQKGLNVYNNFIQKTFVKPGLLKFSQGDKKKAEGMQKQVDIYKVKVLKSYQNQYPYNKISQGFVKSLNECTQKAVPNGRDLTMLKTSFIKMVELMKNQ